jgi:uncharacterized surface protein with fasciclin (FAS1) repeats
MAMTGNRMIAVAATALLALAGCKGGDTSAEKGTAAAEVSNDTLAKVLAGDGDLSVVAGALDDAGLAQVFDGAAAYTILAPTDTAFDRLGEATTDLTSPEQRPAMVAILRDHIVPGYLTPADIGKALEASNDGKVAMKTMGGHTLTFSGKGADVTVTAEDGATAHFAGDALRASNGVAIPLDGLLKATTRPTVAVR